MATNLKLIPLRDDALQAACPGWPFSAWTTGRLIREGELACIRVGKRIFVSSELLEEFVAMHREERVAV